MSTNPTLIPNIAMSATVAPEDMTRRAERIKGVPTSLVHVDAPRLRPINAAKVNELAESIKEHGLLQPIGVQQKKAEAGKIQSGYRLIYGQQRLAAIQQLFDEGVPGADTVPCVIYPSNMPEGAMLLDEIVENLHRKELTSAQIAAHTMQYVALLKAIDKVQGRRSKQAETQAIRKGEANARAQALAPTITEEAANTLGISRKILEHRAKVAVKLAEREGVIIDGKKTVEAMDKETVKRVANAATLQAEKKIEKARAEGKAERHVDPYGRDHRLCYVRLTEFVESLENILSNQWQRSDSPLSADILKTSAQLLLNWADKWQEKEGTTRGLRELSRASHLG